MDRESNWLTKLKMTDTRLGTLFSMVLALMNLKFCRFNNATII